MRGFSRRRPDVDVSVLRLANIVGPGMHTAITEYFELPVVPVVAAATPRLAFLHEDDAVASLVLATCGAGAGTTNVAGDGVITVAQAAHAAGRLTVPVPGPLVAGVSRAVRKAGLADFSSDQVAFLSYGRGLDTTRMREVLGFEPRWTTRAAFADFVRARGLHGPASPRVVTAAERRALGLVRRIDRLGRTA